MQALAVPSFHSVMEVQEIQLGVASRMYPAVLRRHRSGSIRTRLTVFPTGEPKY